MKSNPRSLHETLKVAVSGVRGVVGSTFTPQLAATFAQAFGTFVGAGPVLVGRDTRPSGPMIELAVIAGLQSVGCTPVLAGVAPTPTLLILTARTGIRGGIAITASHNPGDWNALKFIGPDGLFLSEARMQEFIDVYHQREFPLVQEQDIRRARVITAPTMDHFQRVLQYVHVDTIQRRKLRVAVDGCNGVGAVYSARFLTEMLGCDVVMVHGQPSGLFEREPEPLPQHLGALSKAVIEHGCDIGFAQDPDGDRLAVVDEKGRAIGEDMTLALAIWQVLDRHERGPVCINLPTSKIVDVIAGRYDCEVIRTRIGEINVAESMLKNRAVVGGENIGGVMIARVHPCRDSFGGMAVICEMLAGAKTSISERVASLPHFAIARDKWPIRPEAAPAILRRLRAECERDGERFNLLDGLFIDRDQSWVHIRRSNTETVMRVTAEAATPEAARGLVDAYMAKIKEV